MKLRNPFRRRRVEVEPFARSSDGTWMRPHEVNLWHRMKGISGQAGPLGLFRRVATAVGRGLAGGVETRAITEVPWDVGGSRWTRPTGSIQEAARLGPVFAAGRLLATSVSSLPLHTYRKVGKVREQLPQAQLFTKPGRHGTLRDWLFRAMTSLVYTGNAVGWVLLRDGLGYPTMIEWLDVNKVHVDDLQPSGPGSYMDPIWRYEGRIIPAEDIVHIPWFPIPMRVLGLSPIEAFAASWFSAMSAWEYVGDWFAAGGVPPGTFKNTARLVPQAESNAIKAILTAAIRTHEPLVFGKDWEYTPFTIKPSDALLVDLLKLTATDVAAIYGIPAEKIGGQTAGNLTYQTVELQGLDYLQFTLLGWVTMLEAAFFELLPRPRYVKFNVDAIVRPELKARYETYKIRREIGMNNVDELRAMEDELPLPDGQGTSFAPLAVMVGATKSAAPSGLIVPPPGRAEPPAVYEPVLNGSH